MIKISIVYNTLDFGPLIRLKYLLSIDRLGEISDKYNRTCYYYIKNVLYKFVLKDMYLCFHIRGF